MSAAPVATAVPAAAAVSVAAAATNVARGYASMETALHRPIPANNEDTAFDFSEENYKEVERILSKVWWLGVHLFRSKWRVVVGYCAGARDPYDAPVMVALTPSPFPLFRPWHAVSSTRPTTRSRRCSRCSTWRNARARRTLCRSPR